MTEEGESVMEGVREETKPGTYLWVPTAERKVTPVLISCWWKCGQYQDGNMSFSESLKGGAQWAHAVNIQNIVPASLSPSAPFFSTLCYLCYRHTHTHGHS